MSYVCIRLALKDKEGNSSVKMLPYITEEFEQHKITVKDKMRELELFYQTEGYQILDSSWRKIKRVDYWRLFYNGVG